MATDTQVYALQLEVQKAIDNAKRFDSVLKKIDKKFTKMQAASKKFAEKTSEGMRRVKRSSGSMSRAIEKSSDHSKDSLSKLARSIRRVESGLNRTTRAAERTQSGMRNMGNAAKAVTPNITAMIAKLGVFVALTAGVRNVTRDFVDFDEATTIAAAKFAATDKTMEPGRKGFEDMRKTIRGLAEDSEHSATSMAGAVDFWAKAGKTWDQTQAVLPVTLDFASAIKTVGEDADIAAAGDILSDALGQFGLDSKDQDQLAQNTQRIADVMASAANSANMSASELFESFKTAGPIMKSVGGDIEEAAALMAVMANAGIKGSIAGRMLKTATVSLTAATPKQTALLKEYNIQVNDQAGNFRGVTNILADLDKATKKLGTGARTEVFAKLVGREGIAGFINLLDAGADVIGQSTERLRGVNGEAKRLGQITGQSTAASLKRLSNRFKEVGFELIENTNLFEKLIKAIDVAYATMIKVGDYLTAIFAPAIAVLSYFIGDATKDTETMSDVFAALIAIFVGAKAAMLLYQTAVVLATAKQWLFNAAVTANPIGLVIVGIVAAITFVFRYWNTLVASFEWGFTKIAEGVNWIKLAFLSFLNLVLKPTSMLLSSISELFGGEKIDLQFDTSGAEADIERIQRQAKDIDFDAAAKRDDARMAELKARFTGGFSAEQPTGAASVAEASAKFSAEKNQNANALVGEIFEKHSGEIVDSVDKMSGAMMSMTLTNGVTPQTKSVNVEVGPTTVNINASSADAKQVGKIARKEISKQRRMDQIALENAAKGIAVSQS